METVAFYSYKGGVGRSLLLANAARFLTTQGKRVVAVDFDFEAPGLHYKLGGPELLLRPDKPTPGALANGHPRALFFGAVPYLIAVADEAAFPPSLAEHLTTVPGSSGSSGWLALMPAGPAPYLNYWKALKDLNSILRLGDPSGRGLMALLDLQARVAAELNPNYLLIDARTGLTELGGLATTVLADTVVCMSIANQESIDGTLAVVAALKAAPRLASQKALRVVPVLSRAMWPPDDQEFRYGIGALRRVGDSGKLFTLPDDQLFEFQERKSAFARISGRPLVEAYLELFQNLFPARADLVP